MPDRVIDQIQPTGRGEPQVGADVIATVNSCQVGAHPCFIGDDPGTLRVGRPLAPGGCSGLMNNTARDVLHVLAVVDQQRNLKQSHLYTTDSGYRQTGFSFTRLHDNYTSSGGRAATRAARETHTGGAATLPSRTSTGASQRPAVMGHPPSDEQPLGHVPEYEVVAVHQSAERAERFRSKVWTRSIRELEISQIGIFVDGCEGRIPAQSSTAITLHGVIQRSQISNRIQNLTYVTESVFTRR